MYRYGKSRRFGGKCRLNSLIKRGCAFFMAFFLIMGMLPTKEVMARLSYRPDKGVALDIVSSIKNGILKLGPIDNTGSAHYYEVEVYDTNGFYYGSFTHGNDKRHSVEIDLEDEFKRMRLPSGTYTIDAYVMLNRYPSGAATMLNDLGHKYE